MWIFVLERDWAIFILQIGYSVWYALLLDKHIIILFQITPIPYLSVPNMKNKNAKGK